MIRTGLLGLVVTGLAGVAWAAGTFTSGIPPASGPLTGIEAVPSDTNVGSASESITTALLAAFGLNSTPRNYLDNGAMDVAMQGTGEIACGTTATSATQFAANRWFCNSNAGGTLAKTQIAGAGPAPPTGFSQYVKAWRNAGANTQPVCLMQAVETSRTVQLAGKNVMLSGSLRALAGLSSVSGRVQAYIIAGTGSDQGFATLTASPAITPAWTGLTGGGTPDATWTLSSSSWTRYNTVTKPVAAGTTELGVLVCFTPTGSGGATDGFAMTGLQLEAIGGAVGVPSSFEYRLPAFELWNSQRFYWQLTEPQATVPVSSMCQATGAASNTCVITLPVQFRGTLPVLSIPTVGSFQLNQAGVATTVGGVSAGVCGLLTCSLVTTNPATPGQAEILSGNGGSGVLRVVSDRVM